MIIEYTKREWLQKRFTIIIFIKIMLAIGYQNRACSDFRVYCIYNFLRVLHMRFSELYLQLTVKLIALITYKSNK